MRLLLTSDLHLTPRVEHAYRLEYLNWIARTVTEQRIESVVICGDLVDAKDRHCAWFVNAIVDSLVLIANQVSSVYDDGKVHLLFGNHDGPSKDEPYWAFLRHMSLLGIHYHTKIAKYNSSRLDVVPVFVPFGCEQQFLAELGGYPDRLKYVTFMHASADNALVESGIRLENKGMPNKFVPAGLAMRVFSGDIHVPQVLGDITYIGAPYHTRFGDQFTPRTLIYDTTKDALTTLRYDDAPELLTMRVEVGNAGQVQHYIHKYVHGRDLVKLVGTADHKLMPADWQQFAEYVSECLDEAGARLWGARLEIVRTDADSTRAPSSRRSDSAIVRTYAQQQSFSDETTQAGLAIVEPGSKGAA